MILIFSCGEDEPDFVIQQLPEYAPQIDEPEENQFSWDRFELGRKLFFDTRLSADLSISCASCHRPDLGFSDDQALSVGVENRLGRRNSSALTNIGLHPYFTREGGVPTLEMQVLVPIQEHDEFDFNILQIVERLESDEEYQQLSQKAYDREFDYFVLTRAIAAYERSFISANSAYDQFERGDKSAMSESALRGMDLFFSERSQCSSCHSGFNFTNYALENNGLYEVYPDSGLFRLTSELEDIGKFKVPSLRNILQSAPYMHDGSRQSLEEVVEHYNNGGSTHPNKSDLIRPLNLDEQEKADLVAFLSSLSDYEFLNNALYYP